MPDVQAPVFSRCTVPLVLHLSWFGNYGHAWQALAWLFTQLKLRLQRQPGLAQRLQVGLPSPAGSG